MTHLLYAKLLDSMATLSLMVRRGKLRREEVLSKLRDRTSPSTIALFLEHGYTILLDHAQSL